MNMQDVNSLDRDLRVLDAEELAMISGGYFSSDSDFGMNMNPIVAAKVLPLVNIANVATLAKR